MTHSREASDFDWPVLTGQVPVSSMDRGTDSSTAGTETDEPDEEGSR